MAKIDLMSKDWCELIFKDRNKEYGAYDMRIDTPKRHNMATLIVVIGHTYHHPPFVDQIYHTREREQNRCKRSNHFGRVAQGRNQTQ